MKHIKYLLILAILAAIGWFAFNYFTNQETEDKPRILRNLPLKVVEIFDASKDSEDLYISKSGKSAADITSNVTPQINGQVIAINVKVGDEVNKNDILIELGDSLNTDTIDTQYSSSVQSEKIARESQKATQESTNIAIETAYLSARNAVIAYNSVVETKETTQDILQLQINNAELNYEAIENNLEDLEDQLDDLEDDLDDAQDDSTEEQIETQIDQIEKTIEATELQLDQTELAIDQAKENYKLQIQQLNNQISSAKVQCEIALRQVESTKASAILQELQAEGQVIQASTTRLINELQFNEKNIKAPIDGVVTSITVEEGNLVSPGQVILKVEKTDKISIRTSLNEKEAKFIRVGDEADIEIDGKKVEGEIVSISPSLNAESKKIDVEIEVKNQQITAGAFAEVNFKVRKQGKTFIPVNSIQLRETDKFVWVIDEENMTSLQAIKTGEIIGNFIEVTDGLSGDEIIIRTTSNFLTEGEKVEIASK